MKLIKKLMCTVIALCMTAGLLVIPAADVKAASVKATAPKAVHIYTGDWDDYGIEVKFGSTGDYIKSVKSSSKNLVTKVTRHYTSTYDKGFGNVGLYAKKKGTYNVSIDVYNKAKKKVNTLKVKVYVNSDTPIKQATFDGKSNYDTFYSITTKKSGKFAVTMNSGYKFKGLSVTTYNKSGKEITKKYKSKSVKVTLGQYASKTDDLQNDNYYYSHSMNTSIVAPTIFRITYVDKYTKQINTMTYRISRLAK